MLGLVSTMAEESQFFRSKLNMLQQQLTVPTNNIKYQSDMMGAGNLIHVSDDEDEDEEDDEESGDEESEDGDDESEDESGDEESGDEESGDEESGDDTDDEENNHVINLSTEDIELNKEIEDLSLREIKTVHLEEPIDFNIAEINLTNEEPIENVVTEDNMLFLKNVSINDLGELEDINKPDYKKMSLNKLREAIVNKGLVEDASKLKKNEILKLLEDE
jgi:cobalamin biosynthesis protein CobT